MTDDSAVLTFKDLKEKKKWPFTADYTRQLVRKGRFPKPFKAAQGTGFNLWLESDVDAFLSERARAARTHE